VNFQRNKYGNTRSWSDLCQREFASLAEKRRGEALRMLEMAGEINTLEYQPRWVLCEDPRITYTADFIYYDGAKGPTIEDVKGILTDASRLRMAWLKQRYGLVVTVIPAKET